VFHIVIQNYGISFCKTSIVKWYWLWILLCEFCTAVVCCVL